MERSEDGKGMEGERKEGKGKAERRRWGNLGGEFASLALGG